MRTVAAAVILSALCLIALPAVMLFGQEHKASALVVLDNAGKEIPLKTWKFTQGTRRLSWLAEAKKGSEKKEGQKKEDDKKGDVKKAKGAVAPEPVGPECLALIEEKTPTYVNDVTTFIPLTSLKKIEFDHD